MVWYDQLTMKLSRNPSLKPADILTISISYDIHFIQDGNQVMDGISVVEGCTFRTFGELWTPLRDMSDIPAFSTDQKPSTTANVQDLVDGGEKIILTVRQGR